MTASKKKCSYCNGKGLYPICPKCSVSIDFSIQRQLRKQAEKKKYKTPEEEVEWFRHNQNLKDLDKMLKVITKVGGDTNGVEFLIENEERNA